MKNTLLFTVAGVVAIGGITFAALHDWSGDAPLEQTEVNTTNSTISVEPGNSTTSGVNQSQTPYAISFYYNEQVFRVNMTNTGFTTPVSVANESDVEVIEMEKYYTTSVMPQDVFEALPISQNMIFYSGLQSNLDPNLWLYTERMEEGEDFNVRSFNVSTKESKVLFGKKNSPNSQYAFKPFAFSNDNSVVYLEAFVFDSYLNNTEIWELNLNTLAVRELKVHAFYNSTPAMSPDGKYLLYPAGSQPNDVHVSPNQLYVYDLANDKETLVIADEKAFIGLKGWIKSN